MTSAFERLPAEVFDIIAASLTLPEYQTIRLTSQRLHLLTLSSFNKKYFTKLITTLGSPSLDRLVRVASHAHLSRLVTTLEVRLLTEQDYKELGKIARIGLIPPPKRFPKIPYIRDQDVAQEATLYDDVLANRQAKCITERLARSLQHLSNLTALTIRTQKPEAPEWKTLPLPSGDSTFRTRCLRAVLDALAQSTNVRLATFTMAKQSTPYSLLKPANIPYPSLQLPLEHLQRLRPSFSTLTSLTLSIVAAHNDHHRLPGWENSIGRLVSCAPLLVTLSLSLDRKHQVSQYAARIIRSLSDALQLDYLEDLNICNASAHESDLAKLVKTHAGTLLRVGLKNVSLLTGEWERVLAGFKGVEALREVRLANVDVEGGGRPVVGLRQREGGRERGREKRKITLDVDKTGKRMGELLDEVIKACADGGGGMYA